MDRQKMMEESFRLAHQEFTNNLNASIGILEEDITEAAELGEICTDEWCRATEDYLDDLAKMVYSISEPRWFSKEDSMKISHLRHRVHDLYSKYKRTNH